MSELTLTVDAGQAGARLDRFLAEPLGSRARAQALIEAGAVSVDGRAVAKRHVLTVGQTVLVALPDEPSVSVDPVQGEGEGEGTLFTVAFEDEHLLVVDKPAGVVVHPARGHSTGTLSQALPRAARAGAMTRAARGSSIGWTATPRGCWSSPALMPSTGRSRSNSPSAS